MRRAPGSAKLRDAAAVAWSPRQLSPALSARIREVLADRPSTESELRSLSEEADAWMRALQAQIQSSERRVSELSADPSASLAPIAAELRRIESLRPELVEVTSLHEELESRARAMRTEWLLRQADSARRMS
jgi:chromosome segregation ATPase